MSSQSSVTARALTVRLDPKLYDAVTQLARKRAISLNSLVQDSLSAVVEAEEEQARFAAYTLLGQDTQETDVEYSVYAQAEVMLRDDT